MTPEWIDQNITGNKARHFAFSRWVLGEGLVFSILAAIDNARRPLTLDAMKHIASRWGQGVLS